MTSFRNAAFQLLLVVISLNACLAKEICAGCPVEQSPDDDAYLMVTSALNKINSDQQLFRITHVTKQMVSGVKYTYEIETTSTDSKAMQSCKMVLLSQPWVSKEPQLLSFTCQEKEQNRVARQLFGGLKDFEPSESGLVRDLADFAVRTLDDVDADDHMRVVEDIIDAKKQLVNGIMYHLKLRVKTTACVEGKPVTNGCLNEKVAPTKVCSIQLHRSFADNSPMNAKVVNAECSPSVGRSMTAGGYTPVSPDKLKNILDFAVDRVNMVVNSAYQQGLLIVHKAESQVVAGINYDLVIEVADTNCLKNSDNEGDCSVNKDSPTSRSICHVVVYEKPWENFLKITKLDCGNTLSYESAPSVTQVRRRRDIPGGEKTIDPSSPVVTDLTKFALSEYDKTTNSEFQVGAKHVLKATSQVVAGTKVTIQAAVGPSDCKKGENKDNCNVDKADQICTFVIWDRPWLNKREIMDTKCQDYKEQTKRAAGGVPKPVDVNDPKIQGLTGFVGQALTIRTNSDNTKKVVKVLKASSQVVAGSLTKMTVEVGDTNCAASENKDPAECSLISNDPKDHQVCDITIWEQPWLNKRDVTEAECRNNLYERSSRSGEEHVLIRQSLAEILKLPEDDLDVVRFSSFVQKYEKKYNSKDEVKNRFRIFRANMMKADYLQKTEQGTGIYGATQFADLSKKEFSEMYLGYNPNIKSSSKPLTQATIPDVTLPDEFDWRHYNVVTPVKNQGMCGSCWAFSVTGNIEGQYALKNKKLLSFSEQELIDCDKYDQGCRGGLFDTAYHAIEDLGGLELEREYPYEGKDDTCQFDKTEIAVSIAGGLNISHNETDMAKWMYQNGPISIALNANAMQFYMGGVSHPLKFLCSPKNLDHGVLIVGWGVHTTSIRHKRLPYWIVKNSWGPHWGKQGYYWVYRGDGTCGVNQMPTSAIIG